MKKGKRFAKILIVGQNFENTTGPGITLSNLFSYYPKDKIAVVTNRQNSNLAYCDRVYVWEGEYRYILSKPNANSLIQRTTKHASGVPARSLLRGYLGDAIGLLSSMIVLFFGRLRASFLGKSIMATATSQRDCIDG